MHEIIETFINGNIKKAREMFWNLDKNETANILNQITEEKSMTLEKKQQFINLMFTHEN